MERKYYDLTAAQTIIYLCEKYTIHKQVNNICTSVLIEQDLDFDILEKAINAEYKRNDCFRIRFIKVEKKMKQYFARHEDPEVGLLDFTGKSEKYMERKMSKIARKKVSHFGKQMSKIYLIKSFDGRCGIYFIVSHYIMDSWSITTFFKDLFEVYDAMKNRKLMPKPLYSYEKLLVEHSNYKNTEQYKKDLEFWKEKMGEIEPIYTHVNGSSVLEEYREKKKNKNLRYGPFFKAFSKSDNLMIPFHKELVEKMEGYCIENKVTMQSVVLFALRSYFAKVNKVNDVSMNTVVARRSKLKEKNTGGTIVHYMPIRMVFKDEDTFKSSVNVITESLSEIFRHANISPTEVSDMLKEKFAVPQLATYSVGVMTFQPVKLCLKDGTKIETRWHSNGGFAAPFYLTVMDGDTQGGLKFYYEYQTNVVKEETLKELHSYMVRVIEEGIKNPEISICELEDI